MKVIGICGSPRLGNTEWMLRKLSEEAGDAGVQTELILLREKDIKGCDGCLSCETGGKREFKRNSTASTKRRPQGHCSRCGKVWTLETEQGICQWCGHLAVCRSSQTKPRHIKSSSRRRQRQADHHGNGYDQLQGEWLTYYKVASRHANRARTQDREELLHTIILTLAVAERNNGHKPFTEGTMHRIARFLANAIVCDRLLNKRSVRIHTIPCFFYFFQNRE